MALLLFGLFVMVAAGAIAALLNRLPRVCSAVGAGGAVIGCALGIAPTLRTLIVGSTEAYRIRWDVPLGSFSVALDPLSAWFAAPILGLSALAAIFGAGYLDAEREHKALGPAWFFYNLLAASMTMVVLARNGVLFLIAWESMALASFFLVTFDDDRAEVREAGKIYLIATHLGTAFLLAFFALLGRRTASLDFDSIAAAGGPPAGELGALFLFAVVGFGSKAGFMPLHVWLPEAHPAAPSHVSALMSGVMVKTGIYGLIRAFTLLTTAPPAWWGWTLVAIGVVSGVWGVLLAIAQADLKRLLAYSTVENVGVIALGLGVGLIGQSAGNELVAVLGYSGALLHVLNHAMFKGLLFLGAGTILRGTGTLRIDLLGGLAKRMPLASLAMIVGAVAIVGLPPLNGFAGEFLIFLGAFRGEIGRASARGAALLLAIAGLATIGGLAAVCFSKVVGVALLGEPRSDAAANATKPNLLMIAPMAALAAACALSGLLAPWIVKVAARVAGEITGANPASADLVAAVAAPLSRAVLASAIFLAVAFALAIARRRLANGRPSTISGTWGCGYLRPNARIQYTGSSYVQPILVFFAGALKTRTEVSPPTGLFPTASSCSLSAETLDPCEQGVYRPAFSAVAKLASRLRRFQQGRVQIYVLYVAGTLLALLIWFFSRQRPN